MAASSFKNIPEHLIPSHIQVSRRPIRNAICWILFSFMVLIYISTLHII